MSCGNNSSQNIFFVQCATYTTLIWMNVRAHCTCSTLHHIYIPIHFSNASDVVYNAIFLYTVHISYCFSFTTNSQQNKYSISVYSCFYRVICSRWLLLLYDVLFVCNFVPCFTSRTFESNILILWNAMQQNIYNNILSTSEKGISSHNLARFRTPTTIWIKKTLGLYK